MSPDPTPPAPLEEPPSGLRTTIILAVIVVGLLALWRFGDYMDRDTRVNKDKRVFPFLETKDVDKAELTTKAGSLVLARDPAAPASAASEGAERKPEAPRPWRVEAPVRDLAEESEVFRVLNALEWLEYTGKLEGGDAKDVTFGEVAASVRLERSGGKPPIAFELGAENLGTRPIRVASEPDVVYLVKSPKLHEDLGQDPWKFRKKQLFDLTRDLIDDISLRVLPEQAGPGVAAREVALRQVDRYWRVGDAQGEFADESAIAELLNDAFGVRALDRVVDAPKDEDLARHGLAPARATLRLSAPGKDGAPPTVQELSLGAPVEGKPDQRYARFAERPVVFTVDASALKNELERPLEGWRTNALVILRGDATTLTGFAVELDDGTRWGLTQSDKTWTFDPKDPKADPKGRVVAASGPTEALIADVLALEALERVPGPHDKKALGLDPPQVKVAFVQEPLRRELHLGAPVPGAPGVHYAVRVGEDRVFTTKLDALPSRLRDAPLELLDRTIFKASEWEAKRLVLTDAEGKVVFEAKGEGEVREWKVTTPPSPDAVSDRVRELVARFKEVKVERWSAADSPEARRQVGLDRPLRLAVTVETFKDGKPADAEKVLLLGRREGERIHAVAEGGTAIGKVDATFLDVIARGFAKGTTILETDRWDVKGLVVKEGEQVVLELKKPAENWLRTDGGAEQIVETVEVEDLLQRFERVEVTRAEPRADARLAEVGLAPPARTITITSRPSGGAEVKRTLLLGKRAGDREWWATAEGASSMGALFDEPIKALDAWREAHAPPSQFPPVDEPDERQGSAPPPAPAEGGVACATCKASLPGGGPFQFRDPNPPHARYETCSMGHLEELKAALAEGRAPDPANSR